MAAVFITDPAQRGAPVSLPDGREDRLEAAYPGARFTLRRRGVRPMTFTGMRLASFRDEGAAAEHAVHLFEREAGGFVASVVQCEGDEERVLGVVKGDCLPSVASAVLRIDPASGLSGRKGSATELCIEDVRESLASIARRISAREPEEVTG